MELLRDDDGVVHHIELGLNAITFKAHNIRNEKTGVHARLAIAFNGEDLAFTVCNIDRHEERNRLANFAHKCLGTDEADASFLIPKGELLLKFNQFCSRVWSKFLSVQTPEEIAGDPTVSAVDYALKPHVLTGGGTIMYGKPGKGKSFTGMMMALAVNYGTNHFWETEQGKSVFINLERPKRTMSPRIAAVSAALGLDPISNLSVMNNRGQGLVDIHDALEDYIQKKDIKFVVLDSISRAGAGDMKEDRVATRTIDMMNNLGVSWLAIAHTPKYDDSVYYGSGQYEAGADVMLRHSSAIIDDKGSIAVLLDVVKANDMPVPKPMGLHYTFDQHGLSGIRFATKDETADLIDKKTHLNDSIQEYLEEVGTAHTATQLATALNVERGNVTTALRQLYKSGQLVAVATVKNEKSYGLKSNATM